MKIRALFLIAMLSVSVLFAGCHDSPRPLTPAERFVNNLGYSYYLAKDPTASGPGWIVVQHDGYYYAIDINYYARWNYSSDWSYFWAYAVPVWYAGGGYYEDVYGNLYEKTQGNSKDLLAVTAKVQEAQLGLIADKISADYGLSEERGMELAKMAGEWNELKNSRELTDADADKFSVGALGFKLSDAIKAGKDGDTKAVDKLIEKAAETNDTTPENIRNIMVKFITN
jgi:hypothetical protein